MGIIVAISQVEVYERAGNPVNFFNGPAIKMFQTDAPYGCIISSVRNNTRFPSLASEFENVMNAKGVTSFNPRYTKGYLSCQNGTRKG